MNLAYIPTPSVSSFSIGPITIRFYAIMILIGICACVWITTRRWTRVGGAFDQILDLTLVSVPSGIVGARLYHVITTPELYFGSTGNFVDIFKIWQGGLGIWGGVALGGLAAWGWCRHKHYPFALFVDALAPGLLVAQAIGRLGNWFNQELYGSPTTLPWGLKLNETTSAFGSTEACYTGSQCPSGTLVHPTFLYELIWNLIGAALIIYFTKIIVKRFKAGTSFALYVMWYTLGRTWIEALRIDYAHTILGIRLNVWVSMIVFVCGIIAFILIQSRGVAQDIVVDKLNAVSGLEKEVENGKISVADVKKRFKEENERAAQAAKERHEAEVQQRNERRAEIKEAKARVAAKKAAQNTTEQEADSESDNSNEKEIS